MTDDKTTEKSDLPDIRAKFAAKYLHAVSAILDKAAETEFVRPITGFFIEPCERGGVFVIATCGSALAVFHDPDGAANKPFKAHLPRAFRERCAPPKPIEMFSEGLVEIDLPEWAQPGQVYLYPISAMLAAKMHHPHYPPENAPILATRMIETGNHWRPEDYRITEGGVVPWRQVLKHNDPAPTPEAFFDPGLIALFAPVFDLAFAESFASRAPRDQRSRCHFRIVAYSGSDKGAVLTLSTMPNFIGAVAAQHEVSSPEIPWFARAAEPAPEVGEQL